MMAPYTHPMIVIMRTVVGEHLGTSGLDWGNLDTEIDNPLLDVDDTERGGPENIFIHRAGDQFYDVYVDYYDGVNETLPEIEVWYGNDLIDIVYYSANLPRFTQGGLWHAATVFVGVEGSELWMTLRRFPFPGVSRASSPQSYRAGYGSPLPQPRLR